MPDTVYNAGFRYSGDQKYHIFGHLYACFIQVISYWVFHLHLYIRIYIVVRLF